MAIIVVSVMILGFAHVVPRAPGGRHVVRAGITRRDQEVVDAGFQATFDAEVAPDAAHGRSHHNIVAAI